MSWLSRIDPSRGVKKALRAVDKAVGGAKGWTGVLGAAAAAVNVIPGVGQVASAGLAAAAGGTAAAARNQAQAKATREVQAQQQAQLALKADASGFSARGDLGGMLLLGGGALLVILLVSRR